MLIVDRTHSQEIYSIQELVYNVYSFVVFHIFGVTIQDGEILFCLANLVDRLEHI